MKITAASSSLQDSEDFLLVRLNSCDATFNSPSRLMYGEAEKGFSSEEKPASRQDLRPPKDIHFTCLDTLYFILYQAGVFAIAIFHAMFLSIYKFFYRHVVQKPACVRGRVCFVTGSGRGLGREICLELARNGAIVACADINEFTNAETLELIEKLGGKTKGYKLNVANKKEVEEIARRVESELGPVYLVVNNAAIVMPLKDPTEEYVRAVYNVNALGHYWVTEAFLPFLKSRDEGHILNICSIGSLIAEPFLHVYCSTKAAVRNLTQALYMRLKLEKSSVRVTLVHPHFMNTAEEYEAAIRLKGGMKFLPMSHVVETVMESIKYGELELSTPSIMTIGLLLLQLLPIETTLFVRNRMVDKATLPDKDEYENLPHGNLVRNCSEI